METTASQRRRTNGANPFSSLPTTSAIRTLAEWQVVERLRRLARQADRPHTQIRHEGEGGGDASHHGERKVLNGSSRRLRHRRRKPGRPVARQHHPGDTGTLGAA